MTNIGYSDAKFDWLEIVYFHHKDTNLYCIWYSNDDQEGFLLSENAIRTFSNESGARDYLKCFPQYQKEIKVKTYDVDKIEKVLDGKVPFDAELVLDFWNIVADIAHSNKVPFEGDKKDNLTNCVYDKLFYGNNLPEINTSGRTYVPQFTENEFKRLTAVLVEGVVLIKRIRTAS